MGGFEHQSFLHLSHHPPNPCQYQLILFSVIITIILPLHVSRNVFITTITAITTIIVILITITLLLLITTTILTIVFTI